MIAGYRAQMHLHALVSISVFAALAGMNVTFARTHWPESGAAEISLSSAAPHTFEPPRQVGSTNRTGTQQQGGTDTGSVWDRPAESSLVRGAIATNIVFDISPRGVPRSIDWIGVLALTEKQVEELRALDPYWDASRRVEEVPGRDSPEYRALFWEWLSDNDQHFREILLPHQVRRACELWVLEWMEDVNWRARSYAHIFGRFLDLSPEQVERIGEHFEEANRQFSDISKVLVQEIDRLVRQLEDRKDELDDATRRSLEELQRTQRRISERVDQRNRRLLSLIRDDLTPEQRQRIDALFGVGPDGR